MDDLVRVLIAMILQLDLDSEAWGIYHYASGDTAIGFQFVEAIVAQASQLLQRMLGDKRRVFPQRRIHKTASTLVDNGRDVHARFEEDIIFQ